ncbi:MAG: gamma-glutamyl-gamma-aminobutyrate hydrolase family protein [Nocardioidaceae bacterium]
MPRNADAQHRARRQPGPKARAGRDRPPGHHPRDRRDRARPSGGRDDGADRFAGASRHQQAVKELGRDLVITARSADGIVEAIEHQDAPIVGLQWHPEIATSDGRTQSEPFEWLVQMAHKYN